MTAGPFRDLIRGRLVPGEDSYEPRHCPISTLTASASVPPSAYAYPGGTLRRSATVGELTAPQLEARVDRLLRATPGQRRGAEMEGAGAACGRSWTGEPMPEQGWVAPHIAAEPRPRPRLGRGRRVVRRGARSRCCRRLRDLSDRFYGSHAIQHARAADSLGLSRFLSPDRPRPRSDADAGRAARPGPAARQRLSSRGMQEDALTIATVDGRAPLRCRPDQAVASAFATGLRASRAGKQARSWRRGRCDRRRGGAAGASSAAAGDPERIVGGGARSPMSRPRSARRRSTTAPRWPARRSRPEAPCSAALNQFLFFEWDL